MTNDEPPKCSGCGFPMIRFMQYIRDKNGTILCKSCFEKETGMNLDECIRDGKVKE